MKPQIFMPECPIEKSVSSLDSVILLRNFNTMGWLTRQYEPNANFQFGMSAVGIQWNGHYRYLQRYRSLTFKELAYKRVLSKDLILRYFATPDYTFVDNPLPSWVGRIAFHEHHQSMLLAINYVYYSRFGWNVPIGVTREWEEC